MDHQQELTQATPRIRRGSDALVRGQQLFLIFSFVMFFGVVGAFGIVYFYTGSIVAENSRLKEEIATAENELDPDLLKKLILISATLENGQKILSNHLISSNIFDFLQRLTHPKVAYQSFSYAYGEKKIELSTTADSFAVLARQIAAYEASEDLASVNFAGLTTDPDGNLTFRLMLLFRPNLVHYGTAGSEPELAPE
ncbi:MAG: hypothetical protein HYW88_03540 [Candidatus Sungbacteria bacterium]|nr:hypothetical protein [Candidatus Sungbacteria bacterium]